MVEEYRSGLTMREVAARHQLSTKAVQRAMRQVGAASRTARERAGYPAWVEQWVQLYEQGTTTAEIAARAGVNEQTVRERLRQHGVNLPRPSRPQPRKRDERTISELVDRYVAGETLADIGRDLEVSGARVQQLMKAAGAPLDVLTPMHKAARRRLREQADRDLVNGAMAQDPTLTVRELADVVGMPSGRVKRLLDPGAPARRRPPQPNARESRGKGVTDALATYAGVTGLSQGARVSGPAYDGWAKKHGKPSRAVLVRHFGSWAEATRQAGYQPTVTPRRPYRRLSHEEAVTVVAAFIQDEQKQGRPPNSRLYPAWARQHGAPSLAGLGLYWRWSELVTEALADTHERPQHSQRISAT